MTVEQSQAPAVGVECDGVTKKAAFAGVAANVYGTSETKPRKQDIPYYVHTKFFKSAGDVMSLVRDAGNSPLAAVQLGEKKLKLNAHSDEAWAKASAVVAVAVNLEELPQEIVLTFDSDNLKHFVEFTTPAVHHVSALYGTEDEVPPRYNAEVLWGEEGSDIKQVILTLDQAWEERQEATKRRTERLAKLGIKSKKSKSAKYNRDEEARENERDEEEETSLFAEEVEEEHRTGAVDPFARPGLMVLALELTFNMQPVPARKVSAEVAIDAPQAAVIDITLNVTVNQTALNNTKVFFTVGPFVRSNMSAEYIFARQVHDGSQHKALLAVINAIVLVLLFIFIFATIAFGLGTPYAYEMGLRSKLINYYPRAAETYSKMPTSPTTVTYDPSPMSSPISSPPTSPAPTEFANAATSKKQQYQPPAHSLPVFKL